MSAWLAARTISTDDYPLGLQWQVPGEERAQAGLKSDLLAQIDGVHGADQAKERLHDWITKMPVTGRVPVAIADADWLRASPAHDPVILPGHRVIMPRRPHTVTVLTSSGLRCALQHEPGVLASQYVGGCDAAFLVQVDWAWVVQPDGRVSRFGIARWNAQKQDEPAPGAWIWAPSRADQWADRMLPKLAAFLATQGIAPDTEASGTPSGMDRYDAYSAGPAVTANDWGVTGLLQTPAARMQPAGQASMTLNRAYPYTRINFFLQPYDWVEFGFRYTSMSNFLYGPAIAGGQAYKDKSMDVKFGLLEESACLPQVALGLRDLTGTGLFSGEFLVANKRAGAFDWSMGLGWGYVGRRGNMRNPLSLLSSRYDTRPVMDVGQGGNFSISSYFRGPVSLFGGVQYQSPWEPLILKLEYDGNNYQHEPMGGSLPQRSPWNVGAVYRPRREIEISFGFERGNTLMLGFTLQTDFKKYATPKVDDAPPIPVSVSGPPSSASGAVIAQDFEKQTGWSVTGIEQNGRRLRVNVDDADAYYWRDGIDRGVAALQRDVSQEVASFSIVQRQHGVALAEHQVDREAWVTHLMQPLPPSMQHDPVVTRAAGRADSATPSVPLYSAASPAFESEPSLGMAYNLGGPNGFVLYQLYAEESVKWRLGNGTWAQGRLDLNLLNNYNHFTYDAPSNLPRVRTYIREYLTSSPLTMPNLQLTHVGNLADNQYYSVYAGYLEMMFAGVGAEWMYRSFGSPVAFGVDVNRVRQREFAQHFGLLRPAYQIDTGHATLYWDTGWKDVLATVSAGRYLAGDVGMTFDISRVFPNGVRMGGFFTKTNVSAVQFGEGSFDKGIYLSIPFDVMFTKSSGRVVDALWQPLIRDGGDKLNREVRLYDVTRLLDSRTMQYHPASLGSEIPVPSQAQKNWGE